MIIKLIGKDNELIDIIQMLKHLVRADNNVIKSMEVISCEYEDISQKTILSLDVKL